MKGDFISLICDTTVFLWNLNCQLGRRVSSVVEHSSANPKVPFNSGPGLIPGSWIMIHLTPGAVHNFPKAVGV